MPNITSTAATINTQSHKGKNNVIMAPTPNAIKNNPIVFLNAPTNIIFPFLWLLAFFTVKYNCQNLIYTMKFWLICDKEFLWNIDY